MEATSSKKYSAPALEKGLDILELLSKDATPLSTSTIAEKLGRSNAEIYRMILVLEQRGYIEKSEDIDGYQVTRRLLQLGTEHEPIKDILEYAQPIMRSLAEKTSMSCHIAVESQEQIVVISRVETPSNLSYSVRVGYRRPIVFAASGRILFVNQSAEKKESMINLLKKHHSEDEVKQFMADCKKVSKQGYLKAPSAFVHGVTDLSYPIIDSDHAVATLTIPYIMGIDDVLKELKVAAEEISKAVSYGIVRKL
ncbi:transcriptional regulator, IclR family [Paraglaciecola sp. T6c]|uniref:IclR family transcriptional regulator n=1 Tax=Pseudoalteromonas atlantica (strain T6c / ATCC BAA-1087) TaxID=3042615 RepID=UPI00005C613A|nr:IclR family transcriptional regulator [Paraglaciecola sp. T6c]ABG39324.1 transcriptional regulator, IclR family [Paraglaciecola sp. T6c]